MNRQQLIEKAIRLVWISLESHLQYCYKKDIDGKLDKKFHIKCVKEYIELLKILSELY